jgi:hypothetical protein
MCLSLCFYSFLYVLVLFVCLVESKLSFVPPTEIATFFLVFFASLELGSGILYLRGDLPCDQPLAEFMVTAGAVLVGVTLATLLITLFGYFASSRCLHLFLILRTSKSIFSLS